MATIWRYSVFSILKLEKLRIHPVKQQVLSKDVEFLLQRQKFTVIPGTPTQSKSSPHTKRKRPVLRRIKISTYILFALAIILLATIIKLSFPYPLHASCLVKWQFAEPCDCVVSRLREQIQTDDELQMKEMTIDGDYCTMKLMKFSMKSNITDDISMVFADSPEFACTALAESKARSWYSLFDGGRNYCNLHDFIVNAGYDFDNFFEVSENTVCTQYDMAHCN